MSEYQYYEFRTVNRRLTDKERTEINKWSSRSNASATGAAFEYSYGSFPKDEKEVMKTYFDAMIYMANWSTKQLIFKFPRALVNVKEIVEYCVSDEIEIIDAGENFLLNICISEEEGGEWIEGEGWLDALLPIYHDIMNGDYRSLYILAIHSGCKQCDYDEECEEMEEPPIPQNLGNREGVLSDLIRFFEIDEDLIDIAASNSIVSDEKIEIDYKGLINHLSDLEKNEFLARLLDNETHLQIKLKQRLDKFASQGQLKDENLNQRRTFGEIRELLNIRKEKIKEEKRQIAAANKLKKLAEIEKSHDQMWMEIHQLVADRKPKSYDEAVDRLCKLKELAIHKKQLPKFKSQVEEVIEKYRSLSGLKSRIMERVLNN